MNFRKIPKTNWRKFLYFHIFVFFHCSLFPKQWNAKPSIHFRPLLNQTLEIFPVFLAFPIFLGKKNYWKIENMEKKLLYKNGPYYGIALERFSLCTG